MAELTHVKQGQKLQIKADTWNALIDSANGSGSVFGARGAGTLSLYTQKVKAFNTGATDIEQGDIVVYTINATNATEASPAYLNAPAFTCVEAGLNETSELIAIADTPIKQNEAGIITISGVALAKIATDESRAIGTRYTNKSITNAHILEFNLFGKFLTLSAVQRSGTGFGWALVCVNAPQDAVVPVLLTKDGGSAGNSTTQCSWTYTIKDITDTDTIATAVTPAHQRHTIGKTKQATIGLLRGNDSGTYSLIWTDEVLETGAC